MVDVFSTELGGAPPIASDISLGVGPAALYTFQRDIPDVLGYADFVKDPGVTFSTIRSRIADGTILNDAETIPLLKTNGRDTRSVTVMNGLDDLTLRTYAGRCSAAIQASTDDTRVFNGLIVQPGPGWRCASFKDQHRQRRNLQAALYADPEVEAVGFFDVKNFFGACGHSVTGSLLDAAGAPPGAIATLIGLLGCLSPDGVGLPVGFEGSGPIANLFFREVDRKLTEAEIPFSRWTDDLDTFLRGLGDWNPVHSLVSGGMAWVGHALNEKVELLPKGADAFRRLLDPGRDSMFGGEDPVEHAEGVLNGEMKIPANSYELQMSPSRFRGVLRALGRGPSASGTSFLEERPMWFNREPKATADYLIGVFNNKKTRKALDLDWLMDQAVGTAPDDASAARQLHAARVLSVCRVGKNRGQALKDFASDRASDRTYMAVGAWATRAWAQSRAWKVQQALHLIEEADHDAFGRAALSGITRMRDSHRGSHLRTVRDIRPSIGPAVRLYS